MTDKIAPVSLYPMTNNTPDLARQQLLLPMQPDRVEFSSREESEKSRSLTSRIGGFFYSIYDGAKGLVNRILGRKEEKHAGIVEYFSNDPSQALGAVTEGLIVSGGNPVLMKQWADATVREAPENKELAANLQELQKMPSDSDINKFVTEGSDQPMDRVKEITDNALGRTGKYH